MKIKWNRNKHWIIIILIITIFMYSFSGSEGVLVENLDIPVAVGNDLKETTEDKIDYSVPIAIYLFQGPGNIISDVYIGTARSIGETREDRQIRSNKKFLLGLERIFIIGDGLAKFGIRTLLDILINNPQINDRALVVVYKGNSEDILKHQVKGFPSSAEFIEGLIKNAKQFNFFSEEYTMMNVLVKVDAEGRTTLLPYIELKGNDIELSGIAIFKGDKMIGNTNIEEAKILNLLTGNKVKGMITIYKDPKEYINFYAKSKRKVKCYKEGEKFKFVIDLNLNGTIISNELYKDLYKDAEKLKKFTDDVEKQVKKDCEEFIEKSKNKYETDIFSLGMVAAAKYGRKKGTDWDKVVSESDIEVNVKVKVDTEGRGEY